MRSSRRTCTYVRRFVRSFTGKHDNASSTGRVEGSASIRKRAGAGGRERSVQANVEGGGGHSRHAKPIDQRRASELIRKTFKTNKHTTTSYIRRAGG